MDLPDLNQAEHTQISTSLDVEKLHDDLYRSVNLWVPSAARGVFGGQVISQAVVSATNCVDPAYGLHSLHCYFALNASPAVPIDYHVYRVRDGRSYTALSVRATQNGQVVFVLLCSFQKPEPWQPSRRPSMPNVPPPEACEDEHVELRRLAALDDVDQATKDRLLRQADDRAHSPIAVKIIKIRSTEETWTSATWMRAKNIPNSKREVAYQKCILSYMSDLHFLMTAPRSMNLRAAQKNRRSGPNVLGMASSLDHSVWFYNDDFDCGDWILFDVRAPQVGSGRAIVFGRMFTREGNLIAHISQEGVVRAAVQADDKGKLMNKL